MDQNLDQGGDESDYEHLVQHLVEQDTNAKDTNKWTRVFKVEQGKSQSAGVYQIGPDLIYDKSVRDSLSALGEENGEVVFSPMMFKKADVSGSLESYKLSEDRLIALGQVATSAKARFQKALDDCSKTSRIALPSDLPEEETKEVGLRRSYNRKKKPELGAIDNRSSLNDIENVRVKRRPRCQLTCAEIEAVIRSVKVDKLSHKEAALKHKVRTSLV